LEHPLSLAHTHSQYQEIILIANAKEKFSQTSSKKTTSTTSTTSTASTTATTSGQFKTNFVKENLCSEFFVVRSAADGQRGSELCKNETIAFFIHKNKLQKNSTGDEWRII
jgi:hypothetical protein